MTDAGSNIVITLTTCGRCGKEERRAGAHGERVPTGWATVRISFSGDDSERARHDLILCHACGLNIKDFAYQPRVAP